MKPKNDKQESLVRSRKWEQYLLRLLFDKYYGRNVANSELLDLKYIPELIPSVQRGLGADTLLRDYHTHHAGMAIKKTDTIRKYRKWIVRAHQ